jgi:hypothetical protein
VKQPMLLSRTALVTQRSHKTEFALAVCPRLAQVRTEGARYKCVGAVRIRNLSDDAKTSMIGCSSECACKLIYYNCNAYSNFIEALKVDITTMTRHKDATRYRA